MPITLPDLTEVVAAETHPPVFATVSGAHLYGFPSEDSDIDLRGVHLLAAKEVVGLRVGPETVDRTWFRDGIEIDLVTHDLRKFARLLLTPNGYVLEQLVSPLVVHTGEIHAELLSMVPGLLTSRHAHHYRGFANSQWTLFQRTNEIKPLLYTFRALLTGINLMRAGVVDATLPNLGGPAYLAELIEAKRTGEHRNLDTTDVVDASRLTGDVKQLHEQLTAAQETTSLPERPAVDEQMHDLVVHARLG